MPTQAEAPRYRTKDGFVTRRLRSRGDAGFTLLELSVAMVIFGVLSTIAVGGFFSLRDANAEKGAHREVISALRSSQTRAVSEGTTYCVDFGSSTVSTSWTVYRVPAAGTGTLAAGFSCSSGTKVSGPEATPKKTSLTGATFAQRNGADTAYVLFSPRGAASPGSLTVRRSGSTKTYRLVVDALTGRVADPDGS